MAKIKKYMVGMDSDVTAISLVEMPAIEEDYIYLAKEQPKKICLESDEKHLVIGPVLIPQRPIYRYDADFGEYYIEFSSEVIEKLAYDFMKRSLNQSITLDHLTEANNISVVESWIKTSENDKSVGLGFNLPIGTWFSAMKVEDEETWQRIKNEELNGFSIESFVSLEELNIHNINNQSTMNIEVNETFWSQLKTIFNEALGKVEKPEEEVIEETVELSIEEPVEEVIEEPKDEVIETPVEETVEEVIESTVEVEEVNPTAELEEKISSLETKIAELVNANAELSKQVADKDVEIAKLSKQPSVEKVNIEASKSENKPSFLDFASGRIKF